MMLWGKIMDNKRQFTRLRKCADAYVFDMKVRTRLWRRTCGRRGKGGGYSVCGGRGPREASMSEGVWTKRAKGVERLHESNGYSMQYALPERRGPYSSAFLALTLR